MSHLSQIQILHTTSLTIDEVIEHLFISEKVASWFAFGDASCTQNKLKNAIEIMVLQDHYLEWILPNQVLIALENKSAPPLNFIIHQIIFNLDGPSILKIAVNLHAESNKTNLNILISGTFNENEKAEVLLDWNSIYKLKPVIL